VISLAGALAIGAALPMAYLMWYNKLTTGGFLRFGYDVANRGFQALGFGLRGFVMYKGHGLPVERVARFGAGTAIQQSLVTVQGGLARFWPSGLALPVLFLARFLRVRVPWRYALPFALLPVAYFFYFFQSGRYVFELLPFAMVGTAWLVFRISERSTALAAALAAVILCTNLVDTAAFLAGRHDYERARAPFYQAIESAQHAHSKVLVFVNDTSPGFTEPILQALYAYNLDGPFSGDVVVARDIGAADTLLVQEYPGYFPVRMALEPDRRTEDPWRWRPRITRLSEAAPPS